MISVSWFHLYLAVCLFLSVSCDVLWSPFALNGDKQMVHVKSLVNSIILFHRIMWWNAFLVTKRTCAHPNDRQLIEFQILSFTSNCSAHSSIRRVSQFLIIFRAFLFRWFFFFACQRSKYRLQCTWPYLILRHWYACSNAKRIIFSPMHTPISSGSCLLPTQQAQKHRRGMLCQKPSIRNREAEGEGRRNRMHLLCEHSNSIIEIVEFCVCA